MKKENKKQNPKTVKHLHAAVQSNFIDPVVESIEDHAQVTMDAFSLCYERLDAMAKMIDSLVAEVKRRDEPKG